MAKIANVETSDTFGIWRTRSNAAFDRLSQFAINNSSLYANTVTANNNLNALKNATITKNLLVSGNTTLGAAGKTITSTGVLAHTGNLTVSGNTTLGAAGKTITSTGILAHTGNLTVSGNTSANKATVTSALTVSGNTTFSNPITYGGVTLSNSVTGTGSMVLSASPTFTGTLSAATITATGDITSTSDIGLKSNIEVINNALDKVINMRGITFNRPGFHERSAGVIAQEIECVFPEVVKRNGDGYLTVAYGNMISILIEAIKELKAEIEKLKNGN